MKQRCQTVQIIKDKLYWVSDKEPPRNHSNSCYFNIDNDLQYQAFYQDFGPLNLGKTYKYICELQKLLNHDKYKKSCIFHYTSTQNSKASNSAFLMGAFQIVVLGRSAQKAYQPFQQIKFIPFRDASYGQCSYKCTILDCLRGLDYARKLGWFNYKKFDINLYQHYQRVQNGDLNWIIPKKFVAFSSPHDQPTDKYGVLFLSIKNKLFSPKDYIPIFKKLGVTMVIRLNNKTYDASGFTENGIKHHDLFFTDGTAPSLDIVGQFLQIAENQKGAIAIHCKAGLGRTGCLIGCYAIKHYFFNASDFIGWIRVCRPGSILGPQQHFLLQIQKCMKQQGKESPIWKQISQTILQKDTVEKLKKMKIKHVELSERDKQILKKGDKGQGQLLVSAKKRRKDDSQNQKVKIQK